MRDLVAETRVDVQDLVAPLFVREGGRPDANLFASRCRAAHCRLVAT